MMKSKWVALVLALSIVINLLLAGYVIGQSSKPRLAGDPARMFPRWVHTLPEPRQQELRPLVREQLQVMRPPIREMRQQHRALQAAVGAEPFDAAALAAALTQLRQHHMQVQQLSHDAFVAFVGQLTPAERQALVEDLRAPKPRTWHRPHPPQ